MRFTHQDIATLRAVVPLIFVLTGVYYAFKELKKIRFIRDTPTSKIRSAAQGYVELQGTGEMMAGMPIIAPGSGLKCLWYEYMVEELSQGQDYSNWVVTQHIRSDDCFYLRDDTGVCVIDPDNAHIIPSRKSQWYSQQGWGFFGTPGRVRYTETVLDVETPLFVIGEFNTIREGDQHRDDAEDVLHLIRTWKRDYDSLLEEFDTNEDGQIDETEWEQVLLKAEREVRESRKETLNQPGLHVVAHPKKSGRPYIIAGKTEGWLLWTHWLRFSGLMAVTVVAAIFFLKLMFHQS